MRSISMKMLMLIFDSIAIYQEFLYDVYVGKSQLAEEIFS